MTTKSITVKVRNVYGNALVYPVCVKAQIFAEIGNRETLSPAMLNKIVQLGYTVITAPAELPFNLKQPTSAQLEETA